MASRPKHDSSLMMRNWNGSVGVKTFMSRRKLGRLENSAPEMPSSV